MNRERMSTQRHLLECYLVLHDFRIKASLKTEPLQLTRKADDRDFHLKVDPEWLQIRSHATTQSRLDALGLIPFLLKNGSAWIGVTATGEEVLTRIAEDAKS